MRLLRLSAALLLASAALASQTSGPHARRPGQ
jgi:hypothetical protein